MTLFLQLTMFGLWIYGGYITMRGKMSIGFWTDNKPKRIAFGIILIIAGLLGIWHDTGFGEWFLNFIKQVV